MSELRYPNESKEYRERARNHGSRTNRSLRRKICGSKTPQAPFRRSVERGLRLPMGQRWEVGERVKFSELFVDHNTLLLYSWMYGPNWDHPCPSCTSLMDGFDRAWYSIVATSAEAMSPAPLHQPDGMITQIRKARRSAHARTPTKYELMVSVSTAPHMSPDDTRDRGMKAFAMSMMGRSRLGGDLLPR